MSTFTIFYFTVGAIMTLYGFVATKRQEEEFTPRDFIFTLFFWPVLVAELIRIAWEEWENKG